MGLWHTAEVPHSVTTSCATRFESGLLLMLRASILNSVGLEPKIPKEPQLPYLVPKIFSSLGSSNLGSNTKALGST